MIQRDYILRQITHFTQAVARILVMRRKEQYREALAEVQKTGELFLGLDFSDVRTITYDEVVAALRAGEGRTKPEYAANAAELLRQNGEIHALQEAQDEARHSLLLALQLYLELFDRGDGGRSPDTAARLDALLAKVDPFALPPDALPLLFRYYDRQGHFGRAEDVLFLMAEAAVEAGEATDEIRDAGRAFYSRLLQERHERLDAGGLPRHEVAEGFRAFKQLF